ncbi:putative Zn finger protein [Symbiobacterium terraclitae]|uniref:Zn finger protein n=1 Tax=Symbiobacterium terraclitae TaxID=557451 RepID=A0ABS4JPM7_9FIRM|nr:hypothetical protein [Symbiobacterium terraclitae]MBP2017465.1 putative Zn finger protein [Symbiobacterium terraclitae]
MADWLSERWLTYLQRELLLLPMTPGQQKSAGRGDARLEFARGAITAQVGVGRSGTTATATMRFKPLGQREWRRIEEAIARDPEAARRLLSGSLGPELEDLVNQAGFSLFPRGHGRQFRCTCGERWGCRHQRVLAVRAAQSFAANPFLWLQVLGRGREELLAGVRANLADQARAAGHMPAAALAPLLDPDRFLETETDPSSIPVRPGDAAVPDALLKVLGPLPLDPHLNRTRRYEVVRVTRWGSTFHVHQAVEETAEQVLARYYSAISAGAAALARGERTPVYRDEPLPGRRLPPRERIAGEIMALVDERGGCVELEEVLTSCPTAAALPDDTAYQTVQDAAAHLPDPYLLLAGHYAARRDTLLAGATFRHVITWPEWQARRLSPSGDWFLALTLAGCRPPFAVEVDGGHAARTVGGAAADRTRLAAEGAAGGAAGGSGVLGDPARPDPAFAALRPEVGDELRLTVVQVEPLRLSVQLHRRAGRDLLDPLPADQAAARIVATKVSVDPYRGLSEAEAIQLLLAEGFYRPGRVPDPVWLLPFPAVGEALRWGPDRRLVASYWGRASLQPGITHDHWRDGGQLAAGFARFLAEFPPREQRAASVLAEAWAERWPGNPLDPLRPPPLGAFLHFLLNRVPVIARQAKLSAEGTLQAMRLLFRYLVQVSPAMAAAYAPFLAACEAVEPFRHRLETLPPLHTPEFQLWEMEGFRWLGPELSL